MQRFSCKKGLALFGMVAIVAVGVFFGIRYAIPNRFPADAIFVPRDVATLQEALDKASPGMTIVLEAQQEAFKESVIVEVSDITLTSMGETASLESMGDRPALTIRADGVTIKNLDVSARSIGLKVESAHCQLEGIVVRGALIGIQLYGARGCDLQGIEIHEGKIGMEIVSSSGNFFYNAVVANVTETGMKILGSSKNVFEKVAVTDIPIGISMEQGSTDNEFKNCRVESSSIAGIKIRRSNDNILLDSAVLDSNIGIMLEAVTGCGVIGCSIQDAVLAGISLQQAAQNRILESEIVAAEDVGIFLFQSAENALSYNRILRCEGEGIRLDNSDRNLVMGNDLLGNAIGIKGDRADYNRLLRNSVDESELIGLVFTNGEGNRFLDNRVLGGTFGIALAESSENTILRNRIEDQREVSLSIVNGSQANSIVENQISGGGTGMLVSVSARDEVHNNTLSRNNTGLLLTHPGSRLRIEGNTIERNVIGLKCDDATIAIKGTIALLGIDLWEGSGEAAAPIIMNNIFSRNNQFDIVNESDSPLSADGNWWGELNGGRNTGVGVVSEGVDLEKSAWKGTIAIGTGKSNLQVILGRILQLALTGQGFRVIDLIGMGNDLRVQDAIRMQDVDLIWLEAPDSDLEEMFDAEENLESISIPAKRGWSAIVSQRLADQLPELTLSALVVYMGELKGTLRCTAPRIFGEDAFKSFVAGYGSKESNETIDWAETLEDAETFLKLKVADVAILSNLEEALTLSSEFVALEDDRHVLKTADIVMLFRRELFSRFPEVRDVTSNLSPLLTGSAVQGLISRGRLSGCEPEAVARDFLLDEGLLVE
ncbi:MAG: right-handed parallel beta-helix repeat-containing protein [Candidatus Bipolaricaulota bacterium]|nr:right-handed parallel beta-helix repeat-containing protein [Candidatus Bipolaricaulota bacterium]